MSEENKTEGALAVVSKPAPIALDEKGLAMPKTIEEEYRLASIFSKSAGDMVPKCFNTPEKVMIAWTLCSELGLGRSAIKDMWVNNGVPNIHSDLPLSLVRASGRMKSITEVQFDAKGLAICEKNGNMDADCVSAVCRSTRADTGETIERSFTLAEAKKASLVSKDNWRYYARRMLQMRARSWTLKDLYTDVLKGAPILEWSSNMMVERGEPVAVGEIKAPQNAEIVSQADEINSEFGSSSDPATENIADS